MERLTERKENGFVVLKNRPRGALCTATFCNISDRCKYIENRTCPYLKLIDHLADYEDIGPVDHLRELVQAEKDGRLVALPFVAMIEQSLQDGKMKPYRDQRFNGRYAVVYSDKKKWESPLIDICGHPYDRGQAEERLAELPREEAEVALKGGTQ